MPTAVITNDHGPVEYSEAGSGEPILYFHGTGITGEIIATVEAALIDDGFRLIVPNRPGYGGTPLAGHESTAGCADVAAALLESLGVERAHVMGSSGGAVFAAAFAIRHPARTKSVVLLGPQLHRWDHKRWLPVGSRWTLPFLRRPWLRRFLLWGYRKQLSRMSARQFLKLESGERFADLAGDVAALELCKTTVSAMAQGVTQPGFENDFLVFLSEDVVGDATTISAPVLLLHDPCDPVASVEHVDWFCEHCSNCERAPLHAAGHLVWVGRDAQAMHEHRVRFLRRHSADNPAGAS